MTKEITTINFEANEALKMKEFQSQRTINYTFENVNLVTIVNVKYDSNFSEKYEFNLNESCSIKYYDLYENEKFIEKAKFSYKKDTTDINYYHSNGKLSYHLKWIRNKNKKLLKAISDNVDFNSTFSYDKNGNVIKVISKDGTETFKYYKYDSLGNWLERQIFKNNKPFLYEIREVNLY